MWVIIGLIYRCRKEESDGSRTLVHCNYLLVAEQKFEFFNEKCEGLGMLAEATVSVYGCPYVIMYKASQHSLETTIHTTAKTVGESASLIQD